MSKTVYVGMSGGVDSSLCAALLNKQGFRVVGVFMKNWTQDVAGMECTWKEDYQDAKRVAVKLGIDFEVFDFQSQYKQKVVDYMIHEYQAGRTPNPDIMCNQEVKFKLFLRTALDSGADMIATGHYAKTSDKKLFIAKDKIKDQTYFLHRVTSEALSKTLFPIGDILSKDDVRTQAKKFALPTADKKDSQGICFVGKVGIKEFLSQYISSEPGPIVNEQGQEIGEHDGAIFYTIGQRHGLDVGGGLPYYVSQKNMQTNTVHVTTDLTDKSLWRTNINLQDIHWINEVPKQGARLKVRLRYRGPLVDCIVSNSKLTLGAEQRAIAAGQSAVFYDGEQCLGGGIIND